MIRVSHLSKRYGDHTAVSDISFHIEKGVIYGFLGPNGAGKSTTMNILTGCLSATAGEVMILGHNIEEEPLKAKQHIGYLPEIPPVYMDMTPREYLLFVLEAKNVPKKDRAMQLASAMEKTGVTPMQHRLIRNLSKGYRQRVGIAQALLGDPEIIILDEPTVGLDPKQIIEIRELIRELGKSHTVILSSHILSEVQSVCDKVLIISGGRLLAVDTAENGREGADRFLSSPEGTYDLILMDIQMPVLDGYGAVRMIRSSARADAAGIPIYAMTANTFAEDVARAREAGMNGHIAKPLDIGALMHVLRKELN